jgi:signal transduction histidine kinase
MLWMNRPEGPGPAHAHAEYVASVLERAAAEGRARLIEEVARVEGASRAHVRVTDGAGVRLAGAEDPLPGCDGPAGAEPAPRICVVRGDVPLAGGRATIVVASPGRPPTPSGLGLQVLALVLGVVGVSAWLLARSLTRPLARLSQAARAFGAGDRAARARLGRSDELGQVARAFDDMADRVSELLRAEKELLANVSHELRTPLARIRVALDIAAEGDADTLRSSLGEIAVDLAELERLIADVLTAARLDLDDARGAGGLPIRPERVEPATLLDQAAARFRAAHPARPLEVDVAAELPGVEVDPVLVRRVVDNLLENAHKYSPDPASTVGLIATRDDGALRIEVRDRGVGIAAEDLPRVFRPFFRADASRNRATGGLGLGLALAQRIVEAHRGTIDVTSEVGAGTTVTVRLPVA